MSEHENDQDDKYGLLFSVTVATFLAVYFEKKHTPEKIPLMLEKFHQQLPTVDFYTDAIGLYLRQHLTVEYVHMCVEETEKQRKAGKNIVLLPHVQGQMEKMGLNEDQLVNAVLTDAARRELD